MAYCLLNDVRSTLQRYEIDDSSEPSNSAIEGFIVEVDARINAVCAAQGYSTPISGEQSLALMKTCSVAGACYYTTRVMFPRIAGGGIVQEFREEYELILNQIMMGLLKLPDAPTGSDATVLSMAVNDDPDYTMTAFLSRQMDL